MIAREYDLSKPEAIIKSGDVVQFPEVERNPLKRFWQILGPGLVTGASDDDPSGIGTYSMAGAAFGFSTLWTAVITFPMMTVIQYVCAKIGMVTGQGLADVLRTHYSKKWLYAAVFALFVANTINAGADLGAMAAAVNLLVPKAAIWLLIIPITAMLLALQLLGSYGFIARVFKWSTLALFAYVATTCFVHMDATQVLHGTFVPTFRLDAVYLSTIVAILGTTISPYLFFWQADQEVEEDISLGNKHLWQRRGTTKRALRNRAIDVIVGMLFSNLVMYFIILTTGATLFTSGTHDINSAAQAASALRPLAGQFAFLLFALGIIGTGFLAVPILTASASYAVSQAFGWKHGFRRKYIRARAFYATIAISMLIGMLINYIGVNPINALFWTAVLNGLLAPPLLLLIMSISNNKTVMGSHTNHPAINVVGYGTTAVMFLAAIAMLATMPPVSGFFTELTVLCARFVTSDLGPCMSRVMLGLLLGALIGVERQRRQRLAGLRTNALVATGATLFVLVGVLTPHESSPTRIAAQVVSGIGFLGAGVIMREGLSVTGLNTAATLWCSAAVGALTGCGYYAVAIAGTVSVLVINLVLRPLGHQISRNARESNAVQARYQVTAVCLNENETHIRNLLLHGIGRSGLVLQALRSADGDNPARVEVYAELVSVGRMDDTLEQIVARLSLEPGISAVSWEIAEEEEM
jgi:NRAMP (natural resistance-associated macrophage protein)-like metal ion transporter